MSQIIYVGDGASDIPAVDLLHDRGGITLGVVPDGDPASWEYRDRMQPDRRVHNLAVADYPEGAGLMRSLVLATETICKQVALRRLSREE